MKQWEIRLFPFPGAGAHPAVILSPDYICTDARTPVVNALMCMSLKPGHAICSNEAMLNGADGLDWETVVRCDLVHALAKPSFGQLVGNVSIARRHALSKRLIECFKLQKY